MYLTLPPCLQEVDANHDRCIVLTQIAEDLVHDLDWIIAEINPVEERNSTAKGKKPLDSRARLLQCLVKSIVELQRSVFSY